MTSLNVSFLLWKICFHTGTFYHFSSERLVPLGIMWVQFSTHFNPRCHIVCDVRGVSGGVKLGPLMPTQKQFRLFTWKLVKKSNNDKQYQI